MGGGPEALYLSHQSLASSAAAPSSANRIPPMSSVEAMSMSAPYGLLQSHQSPFPSSSGSTFADEQRLSLSQSLSSRQSMSSSTHSPMGMSDSTMSSPQELNHYPGYWSQNTNQYTNFNSGRNSVNMPLASGSVAQSAYNIQPHTASYQSPPPRSSTGTSSTVVSPHQQQQQLQQPPPISQMMITTVPDHETLPALAQQHPAVDSYVRRTSGFYPQRQPQPPPQPQAPQLFHHSQLPSYNRPTHQISSPALQSESQPPLGMGQLGRPYPSYTLPGLTGSVVPSLATTSGYVFPDAFPGSLSQGYNGHVGPHMSHLYAHRPSNASLHQADVQHPQITGLVHAVPQDRPFKCDLCPQSFNRNHDLKRHKRIHLAVKPFPCKYCDKGFSRKDALKRHTLVKGCGKAAAASEEKSGSTKPSTPGTRSPASIKSLPHSTEQTQTPKRAATHDLSPLHSATEL